MRPFIQLFPRAFAALIAVASLASAVGSSGCAVDGEVLNDGTGPESADQLAEVAEGLQVCDTGTCAAGRALWVCVSNATNEVLSTPCNDPATTAPVYPSTGSTCHQVTLACGCTLPSCDGKCGEIPTDCGGTLSCGDTCSAPDTCGGGGVPNQCGNFPDCPPDPACVAACGGGSSCIRACDLLCES